jgi:hypothetical protein
MSEVKQANMKDFITHAGKMREYIQNINNFRSAILPLETDTEEVKRHKRIFRKLAEIFMKYFAVNWIFSGKLHYRKVYLKHRGSMLRRIRQPESFTYLTKIK